MIRGVDEEIDKKIEEFFFGPGQKIKEYNQLFKKNNPRDPIRRSPLYTARRDIYFCFGMNPEDLKHTKTLFSDEIKFGPAYLAGIWLIWETLNTLANCADSKNKELFISDVLKINTVNANALKQLRNAISHINYGLRIRNRKTGLWQFSLDPSSKLLIRRAPKSNYSSNNYVVNPVVFHQKFEKGLTYLKKRLLNRKNKQLRECFNKANSTKRSNWLRFN